MLSKHCKTRTQTSVAALQRHLLTKLQGLQAREKVKGPDSFSQNKRESVIWSQQAINTTGTFRLRSMSLLCWRHCLIFFWQYTWEVCCHPNYFHLWVKFFFFNSLRFYFLFYVFTYLFLFVNFFWGSRIFTTIFRVVTFLKVHLYVRFFPSSPAWDSVDPSDLKLSLQLRKIHICLSCYYFLCQFLFALVQTPPKQVRPLWLILSVF